MDAKKMSFKGGFSGDKRDLRSLLLVVVLLIALDLLLSGGTKRGFILQLFFLPSD